MLARLGEFRLCFSEPWLISMVKLGFYGSN